MLDNEPSIDLISYNASESDMLMTSQSGDTFLCPLCVSGIFTKPAEKKNQYTYRGLLFHTNYSLLLKVFTITVITEPGLLAVEGGEKSLLSKFISIFQLKLACTKGHLN